MPVLGVLVYVTVDDRLELSAVSDSLTPFIPSFAHGVTRPLKTEKGGSHQTVVEAHQVRVFLKISPVPVFVTVEEAPKKHCPSFLSVYRSGQADEADNEGGKYCPAHDVLRCSRTKTLWQVPGAQKLGRAIGADGVDSHGG